MTKRMWGKLRKLGVIEEIKSRDLTVLAINGWRGYHTIGSYCPYSGGGYSVQLQSEVSATRVYTEEKAIERIISSTDVKTIIGFI